MDTRHIKNTWHCSSIIDKRFWTYYAQYIVFCEPLLFRLFLSLYCLSVVYDFWLPLWHLQIFHRYEWIHFVGVKRKSFRCKYKCIYISTLDSKYCIVFVYIIFSETNMKLIDASDNSYRYYAFSAYAWVQSPNICPLEQWNMFK
jgi:hypothetical protein